MAQLVSPNDERAAVLGFGLDEYLDPARHGDLPEACDEPPVLLGRDAAGAAVGDVAVETQSTEVKTGRNVARPERKVDPDSGQHAATYLVFRGVVAEEPEVTGSGSGGDAGPDRVEPPATTVLGEQVEVGF